MMNTLQLLPVTTPLLHQGDSLADAIYKEVPVEEGDIVVVSSKAVTMAESGAISLSAFTPSVRARELSEQTGRSAEFCELMLRELERMHGTIVGTCPGAALTELRPDGLLTGSILVANAGLDESNAGEGFAIGWPRDPVMSVRTLRKEWETRMERTPRTPKTPKRIALILTDSCCRPRRLGVTAFALAVSGLDPLVSQRGERDLFGKELRITTEAVADQLSTAANFLMGNAGQSTPVVIIRNHGLALSDWEGWVPGIEPEEDLFKGIL